MRKKLYIALAVFVIVFFIYFFTIPPTLAPYRDAGEMAVDVWSMSISHQPGYPLYNVLARFFTFFLPGNFAYKLNLFSAICGAMACAILFLFLSKINFFGAFLISILFSLNFTMHTVSGVSEMYSLHVLFSLILILLFFGRIVENFNLKSLFLFSFLCGLFMGNRMDIFLMYPVFVIFIFFIVKDYKNFLSIFFKCFMFFLLGFSIYLYLPFRSVAAPFLNWSDPSKLENFINVITRKSYGSTLDLISTHYRIGELFLPNLKIYIFHIFKNFNLILLFVFCGFYYSYFNEKRKFILLGGIFLFTGPVFLFLANMPPNPHAISIVEPYYLIPDIVLIIFACFGFDFFKNKYKLLSYSFLITGIFFTAYLNFPYSYRKDLRVTEYYAEDVFRNIPQNSIVVVKKDVQLFSLWYFAYVEKKRQDIAIIAHGLSGSAWYHNSGINKNSGVKLINLNESMEKWDLFKSLNSKRIYATLDVPLPDGLPNIPNGLTVEILPDKDVKITDIGIFEKYNLDKFKKPYNDFFVSDLASSYAQAIITFTSFYINSGKRDERILMLLDKALELDENLADAPLYKGLYYANLGNWQSAMEAFKQSVSIYEVLIKKSEEYYSLDDVKNGLKRGIAYAFLNLGVCYDKLGDKAKSEENNLMALYYNPNLAQAHYNIATLYWNVNKNKAKQELIEALRLNPNHKEAAFYLERLK